MSGRARPGSGGARASDSTAGGAGVPAATTPPPPAHAGMRCRCGYAVTPEAMLLVQLQGMGFTASQASGALIAANWTLDRATAILMALASSESPGDFPLANESVVDAAASSAGCADTVGPLPMQHVAVRDEPVSVPATGVRPSLVPLPPPAQEVRTGSPARCVYGCGLFSYTIRGACCTKCRGPEGPHVRRCHHLRRAMDEARAAA